MSRVTNDFSSQPAAKPFEASKAIDDLDMGQFLRLMIAELQNQDPLNPLDNKDMLAQISQIREVVTDKLTSTLEAVLLGQGITSATNLIGADIDAISDDNQRISGLVSRVSIENGQPKLHVDQTTRGTPSLDDGNVEKGQYSYRVVWSGDDGKLKGMELSGSEAISTEGGNPYKSIRLENMPSTPSAKQIYRTDKTGEGDYQLVTTLTDGKQSSYHDKMSDDERSETRQIAPFDTIAEFGVRRFRVSLNNVAEIRPPARIVTE